MQKLNKDGSVETFQWEVATDETSAEQVANGNWLLPMDQFLEMQSNADVSTRIGIWINSEDDISALAGKISAIKLIAVNFPVFSDGRGFSLGRLVKDSLGFNGEVIAIGDFMQDQLHYLKRCGFDGFIVNDEANIESLNISLNDFSEAYQASADKPTPLFRRRL